VALYDPGSKTLAYDVAISFAGEQHGEGEAHAACLGNERIKAFYDDSERADPRGKTLSGAVTI
jgi:hypothetical protein